MIEIGFRDILSWKRITPKWVQLLKTCATQYLCVPRFFKQREVDPSL